MELSVERLSDELYNMMYIGKGDRALNCMMCLTFYIKHDKLLSYSS